MAFIFKIKSFQKVNYDFFLRFCSREDFFLRFCSREDSMEGSLNGSSGKDFLICFNSSFDEYYFPLNFLNSSFTTLPPPRARIVSRNLCPISFIASLSFSPAASNAETIYCHHLKPLVAIETTNLICNSNLNYVHYYMQFHYKYEFSCNVVLNQNVFFQVLVVCQAKSHAFSFLLAYGTISLYHILARQNIIS